MKRFTLESIDDAGRKIARLLFIALAAQSVFALDYPEDGDFSRGSKVWAENCARCHNMRNPSDLRDGVTSLFHMRVRAGLTGRETRDILTFLKGVNNRSWSMVVDSDVSKPEAEGLLTPNTGKNVYENNCMACHRVDGKGSLPGVPDFTKKNGRLSKTDNELLSNITNGFQSQGSLMPMPSRGGNSQLSDADLSAALKYIKASFAE